MRIVSFAIVGLFALAMSLGAVFAQTGAGAPFVTSVAVATSSTAVVAANPSRKSIQICNAGTTVVWIWPGTSTALSAYELPALATGTTTCFSPPTGAAGAAGSAGAAWYAASVSAAGLVSAFEW